MFNYLVRGSKGEFKNLVVFRGRFMIIWVKSIGGFLVSKLCINCLVLLLFICKYKS